MWNQKKTRRLKDKHEPATYIVLGHPKKSTPRMRTERSKEKICVPASNSKSFTTTCVTSGNMMRLFVNLMPVLAAAKEPVEEEDGKEEDNSWTSKTKPETSSKSGSSVTESVEQTLDQSDSQTGFPIKTDEKHPQSPQLLLPPLTQPKPAPEHGDSQKTKRCHTPLPPINSSEQTGTISSIFTTKSYGGNNGLVTGQEQDSKPWIDNPLFSKSRSSEFSLPDISLSSLDTLLQTVTQKLERKRRGGDDEGPWRCAQSDHLLMAVSEQRLEEKAVERQIIHSTDSRDPAKIKAIEKSSMGECIVSRRRHLPSLFSASKPTLVLSMTKKKP